MAPDAMTVRLHLRRIRVVAVVVDLIEKLVVEIADTKRVVRCPHCGFQTARVHDRRRLKVTDLPTRGRPTTLVWVRRRFSCGECSERSWEDHPEIIIGRRTHVTRRLARQPSATSTTSPSGRSPAVTGCLGTSSWPWWEAGRIWWWRPGGGAAAGF